MRSTNPTIAQFVRIGSRLWDTGHVIDAGPGIDRVLVDAAADYERVEAGEVEQALRRFRPRARTSDVTTMRVPLAAFAVSRSTYSSVTT